MVLFLMILEMFVGTSLPPLALVARAYQYSLVLCRSTSIGQGLGTIPVVLVVFHGSRSGMEALSN